MTISFIHKWDERAASYRYRAMIPARELNAQLNDSTADVLVYAKPLPEELDEVRERRKSHCIIVDVCDDYLGHGWFHEILKMAHAITCSTEELKRRLKLAGYEAVFIDDPYELGLTDPHCKGDNLLWFGHFSNLYSLVNIRHQLKGHPLKIVSNITGTTQWSIDTMIEELAKADIVVMPKTALYKSPNRTVEAVRRGCFVVAETHPALKNIPGIWIGDIKEGIDWATSNLEKANQWTKAAQEYLSVKHSPRLCGLAWKKICTEAWDSTLAVEKNIGKDGST
jgi:hypothetical protein